MFLLKTVIPLIPPSLNKMYKGMSRRVKSDEYRRFLKNFDLLIKVQKVNYKKNYNFIYEDNIKLKIDIHFHSTKWITKKNTIAKVDVDNRIKPLLDAIEKSLGINDKRYFSIMAKKIYDNKEKTEFIIRPFDNVIPCVR